MLDHHARSSHAKFKATACSTFATLIAIAIVGSALKRTDLVPCRVSPSSSTASTFLRSSTPPWTQIDPDSIFADKKELPLPGKQAKVISVPREVNPDLHSCRSSSVCAFQTIRGGTTMSRQDAMDSEEESGLVTKAMDLDGEETEDDGAQVAEQNQGGFAQAAPSIPRTEAANWTAKLPYPWQRAIDHCKQIYYFYNPKTRESRFTFPPAIMTPRYPNEAILFFFNFTTRLEHDMPNESQFFFLTGVLRPEIRRNTKFYFGTNKSIVHRIYAVEEIGWGPDAMKKIVFQPDTQCPFPLDTKLTITNDTDEKDIRDARKRRILKSLDHLVVTSLAGNGLVGNADALLRENASFHRPTAVAFHGQFETFIVADTSNHAIRKISTWDRGVETISGFNATKGYLDGHAKQSRFNTPRGIACDSQGNIFIADTLNNVIRKIDSITSMVTTWVGQDLSAETKARGWHADGMGTIARLALPHEIRFGPDGNLYVADKFNNRIRKIEPNSNVTTFVGSGDLGIEDGYGKEIAFINVEALGIDASGNLFAATSLGDNRVRKVSPDGMVTTYSGLVEPGDQDGPSETAEFEMIRSIAVDRESNVFVSEGVANRIRRINPSREVVTYAGDGYIQGGWRDGGAAQARFDQLYGICVDDFGRIAVADTGNNKIRIVSFPWQRDPDYLERTRRGDGLLTLNSSGGEEESKSEYEDGNPSKRNAVGFVRPGAKVYFMGDFDDLYEVVEVLEVDYEEERDIIQIRHMDGGNQLVHIDYLKECPEEDLSTQWTKDADRIKSAWQGAFPTPKPTALEVISDGHLENIPYDRFLAGQHMIGADISKGGALAPDWTNKPGTYKGKELDYFGREISPVWGMPAEKRILDPAKVYLQGTTDYPGPDRSFKEKHDVFEYEHKPVDTPFGTFHTDDLEIDPDQYADWVEDDNRRCPRKMAPLYAATEFLEKPVEEPPLPDLKRLRRFYEPMFDEQVLLSSRKVPDLAPRDPIISNMWHKDVGPPPEVAALRQEEERIKKERELSGAPPAISDMPVMHEPVFRESPLSFKPTDKLGLNVVDRRG